MHTVKPELTIFFAQIMSKRDHVRALEIICQLTISLSIGKLMIPRFGAYDSLVKRIERKACKLPEETDHFTSALSDPISTSCKGSSPDQE
jgi:hypothetical protein